MKKINKINYLIFSITFWIIIYFFLFEKFDNFHDTLLLLIGIIGSATGLIIKLKGGKL